MIIPNSDLILAEALAGPNPLGYKLRPDGTLCVIDSKGRKLVFTPAQVAQAGAPSTLDQWHSAQRASVVGYLDGHADMVFTNYATPNSANSYY